MFPEYSREKITINPNPLNWKLFDYIVIILVLLLFFMVYKIAQNSSNPYKIYIITFFIIFLFFVRNEELLQTNIKETNRKIKLNDIENYVNSGDIVIFRSYRTNDISEFFFFLIILPLLTDVFCTHIGLIYKDNTGVYVGESVGFGSNLYSILTGTVKDGVVLNDAITRFSNPYQRVMIYKSNIHKHIDNDRFYKNMSRYKNHSFFQEDVYCCNFAQDVLSKEGIVVSEKIANMYKCDDFINKDYYLIDVKFEKPVVVDNGNDDI